MLDALCGTSEKSQRYLESESFLPAAWNVDVMTGTLAVALDCGVTWDDRTGRSLDP